MSWPVGAERKISLSNLRAMPLSDKKVIIGEYTVDREAEAQAAEIVGTRYPNLFVITTSEGKNHVLCDLRSNAHIGPMKKWVGSSMAYVIPADSISIPTNLEEIVELKMEYIPEK